MPTIEKENFPIPPSRKVIDRLAKKSAISVTHRHLLAVINSKICELEHRDVLRILDAGCGNGLLIGYLQKMLELYHPQFRIEIYGYDVTDGGVQFEGYFQKAIVSLSQQHPGIDWRSRLHLISSNDEWPFDEGFFDIVVSNQVGEHVVDHDWFFKQNHRVLRRTGFAVHLFPLENYIYEGHVRLLFPHYFRQWSSIRFYIKMASLFGFGKWKKIRKKVSVDDFATSYADFLTYHCTYLSSKELLWKCKIARFRADYDYTGEFYKTKLRDILMLPPRFLYRKPFLSGRTANFYKYLASITLVLVKEDKFVNYIASLVYGRE